MQQMGKKSLKTTAVRTGGKHGQAVVAADHIQHQQAEDKITTKTERAQQECRLRQGPSSQFQCQFCDQLFI